MGSTAAERGEPKLKASVQEARLKLSGRGLLGNAFAEHCVSDAAAVVIGDCDQFQVAAAVFAHRAFCRTQLLTRSDTAGQPV